MKRSTIITLSATALSILVVAGLRATTPEPAEPPPSAPVSPDAEEAGPAGFSRSPIKLDAAQRQAIGLTYGVAERRAVETVIRTVGRLDYDERKLAEVTLKVGGWVEELFVDYTGKAVRQGEPLLSLYSPELVSAQQEYLLARRTDERLRTSRVSGAAESAADLVRTSRERLRLWDLTGQQIGALEESGKPNLRQTFHSPISGVVIEKMVLKGSRVEPGMKLYKIADLSTLWVYADVYEYEAPFVRVGQQATITLPYVPNETFTAKVAFLHPAVDAKTRTLKIRFELPSPEGSPLRPEMYGNVELRIPAGERLVVPASAVLDSGRKQVVFVDGGEGRIVPRDVRVGGRFESSIEVTDGLQAGDRVVTSGNFLVDSETKLQAAESMMGMMGAIGMGDWKMESARPMDMSGSRSMEGVEAMPGAAGGAPEPEGRRVGDLAVAVFPAKGDARVGESPIHVRVRDASGGPVTDATVSFNYTMDMPGMTIEQSHAKPLGDGLYEGMARFTMGGPWGLVVEIARPGKPPVRQKFTVRVSEDERGPAPRSSRGPGSSDERSSRSERAPHGPPESV